VRPISGAWLRRSSSLATSRCCRSHHRFKEKLQWN
jgi:hypothetical protein